MRYSQVIAEFVSDHEKEYGSKPSVEVIRVAEHIARIGQMLTIQGQKDFGAGDPALPIAVFQNMVRKAFRIHSTKDADLVHAIAILWQSDYMDGYNKVTQER